MQDGSNSKQLIAEKIKQSANILVTVSANPSVDALTAALGLTLMLNKLDKHATAVFSGVVPPAISFLQPGKTFENNVDSLRDFIIALDKDKADRLRYKVEDEVVRIFITPYRTKISQSDLQFSQGDFNVDLIVALGVEDQKDLDQAITAHGRILHDATVATINAGAQKSSLGSIDWQDSHASSLSEMLASLADSLKAGILDQQISTALLTGIVSSTERFSNQKTTPHVMTISAQLMAAGANQQLIATKLQTIPAPVSPRRETPKPQQSPGQSKKVSADTQDDGEMHINHNEEPKEAPAPLPMEPVVEAEPVQQSQEPEPEPELPIAPPAAQAFDDLKQAIAKESVQTAPQRAMVSEPPVPGSHNINDEEPVQEKPQSEEEGYLTSHPSWQGREIKPPSMGGTLNATSEQALQDKMRAESEEKRNHTILTHGGGGDAPQQSSTSRKRKRRSKSQQNQQNANSNQQGQSVASAPAVAPITPAPAPEPTPQPAPAPQPEPAPAPEPPAPVPQAATPEPEPVAPAPAPEAAPEERLPEIPIAPPPLVVSEPLTPPVESVTLPQPAPAPQPEPAPAPEPPAPQASREPTLEELEKQAVNHAAQAVAPQTLEELEAQARSHANETPAPQTATPAPTELGAMPMPEPIEVPAPAPNPAPAPVPQAPAPAPQQAMPPTGLPPLPPMPDFGALPPMPSGSPQLPELPQQPLQQPAAPQPPQQPASQTPPPPPAPTDPAQFRIPGQ